MGYPWCTVIPSKLFQNSYFQLHRSRICLCFYNFFHKIIYVLHSSFSNFIIFKLKLSFFCVYVCFIWITCECYLSLYNATILLGLLSYSRFLPSFAITDVCIDFLTLKMSSVNKIKFQSAVILKNNWSSVSVCDHHQATCYSLYPYLSYLLHLICTSQEFSVLSAVHLFHPFPLSVANIPFLILCVQNDLNVHLASFWLIFCILF